MADFRTAVLIEGHIRAVALRLEQSSTFSEGMNGIDYEHFVGELLRKAGWSARVSQASGDQGADVIAEKDGVKVVVQCKMYSSPVGNKAVQEVHAAKQFYLADQAWVVTNNSYTTSARQLASSLGVQLLHHDDLSGEISVRPYG